MAFNLPAAAQWLHDVTRSHDELQKAAGKPTSKDMNNVRKLSAAWKKVYALLGYAGIPEPVRTYATAQSLFETAGLTSPPTRWYNYSNIAYTKSSPYQNGRGYKDWASYGSQINWAKDFKRVLSLRLSDTVPIQQTSLMGFVNALYRNKYVGPGSISPDGYAKGLQTIMVANGNVANLEKQYASSKADYDKLQSTRNLPGQGYNPGGANPGTGLPAWAKWGLIGLGGIVVLKALSS